MVEVHHALHPQGYRAVAVPRNKYEQMKTAISGVVEEYPHAVRGALQAEVCNRLIGQFEGSIGWYFDVTYLDLVARQIIEDHHEKS